jgi:putative ABC transport system permease protein
MPTDLVHALRALRRAPAFTLAAVLVLACGVGAASAVFSVLGAVLLRPLPYGRPDELVVLLHDGQFPVSPADYLDYKRLARSYAVVEAAQVSAVTLSGAGEAQRIDGLEVTAGMFDALGVAPALGRTFAPGEDQPGRDHVVVLSHGLWVERFGADRGVVGRSVVLDGERWTVVGVMPEGFAFAPFWATGARLWHPLSLASRNDDRAGRSLRVFARLRQGVALEAARAEASTIAARLASAYPDTNRGLDIAVVPLHEKTTASIRPTLVALTTMVGLVMLVACANVATLSLVRGSSRHKELAVRVAVGAPRARIVRELVAESAFVGVAAAGVGLVLGAWGVAALVAMVPPHAVPRQGEIGLDPVAFGAAAALGILAAVISGLVPALQLARTDPQEALRDGSRTATSHGQGRAMRRALVAVELTLAMVLLAGAGLMGRTLVALQAVDPGFDPANVLALTVAVDGLPQAQPARRVPYFEQVATALGRVPGVERLGAINHLPLAGDTWRFRFEVDGRPQPPAERSSTTWRVVTPGYFEAMRLALRGRSFDRRDAADGLRVAVVNEVMAGRHWPGASPIGSRIRVGSDPDAPWLTIVGVAANARQSEWSGPVPEELYVPYAQHAAGFGGTELTFVLRTSGDPAALGTTASSALWSVDPQVPVARLTTMDRVVAERLWRARLTAALMAVFAAVALLLAAVGVFTVTAYVMARRTREIGIRMALGATAADVRRLAAGEALGPVAAGVAAGGVLGLALARLLASMLYDVAPADATSFAGAGAVLVAVALAAAWWPARRASRIAPVRALRQD